MMINCFQIREEPQLTPCDYESAIEAAQETDAHIWIDLQGLDAGKLEEKLAELDIKGLAGKLCLEARDRPGFYPMSELTFLVLPVLADAEDFSKVEHVAFLVRNNLLITLRETRARNLQHTITQQDSADWLPEGSVAGLVSAFTIVLSLESLKRMSDLRDTIVTLEDRSERDPNSIEPQDISQKRSELLILESVVSAQLPILQAILALDRAAWKRDHIKEYLLCALANLQATDRSLDWLEGRIDVMRSTVDMRAQDKMNRRLGTLTILSMIFMPMTLLAGVWGMNFKDMPELNYPLGYPIAIGSMIFIALGMFFYFRRRGWFD